VNRDENLVKQQEEDKQRKSELQLKLGKTREQLLALELQHEEDSKRIDELDQQVKNLQQKLGQTNGRYF
jgi:hypothetical protein